jgi:murein DD-endopeptidase MepM/ murein hydrolase activator NlpD
VPPPPAHQLLDVQRWPDEPAAPADIDFDVGKFRAAVAYLCRRPVERTPADEVLAAAREAGVDPFLLAALMSERSRCDSKRKARGGIGLLALQPGMYQRTGAPKIGVHASEWGASNLASPRANLGLGARLLRMWQEQHDAIDLAFGGVPHRSAVSHFYWGDIVSSSGSEDLVLTARRRLLEHYQGLEPTPRPSALGVAVVPPLEAGQRVATSGPGDDRDGGARRHRGLDIVASPGEPIRCVADGQVLFAGANLRGNPRFGPIPPAKSASYARRRLGAGGLYLCVRHRPENSEAKDLVTCYMHLDRYFVAQGEAVKAGQTIGVVGRSGVRRSPPHLHFEVRMDGRFKDPWRYFTDTIMPPKATLTHRYNVKAQKARLVRAAKRARAGPSTARTSPSMTNVAPVAPPQM